MHALAKFIKKLVQKIHPSFALIIFCLGVIFGDILVLVLKSTIFGNIIWLILAVAILLAAILIPRVFMMTLAFFAGFLIVACRSAPDFLAEKQFENLVGQTVIVSGNIAKDPTESESGKFSLTLKNLKIIQPDQAQPTSQIHSDQPQPDQAQSLTLQQSATPISGAIFTQVSDLKISDDFMLQRSDTVTLRGQLSAGFGTYLATIFRPEIKNVERPEPGDVFLKIRDFFAGKVKDYVPSPESGLALGYLLGQKSGVDQSFQNALRIVGLTHIVVASGAHLSTLTGVAKKLFKKLSRFASLLAAILLTVFFIGITGLSASMLRAGLVTGLSLILSYFGRDIHPLRVIILVAAATLIYDPSYLTDLAWLLSFASFSGILVLAPAITKFFYGKSKKPNFIFTTLIASVSAALLCTPIILYYFGQTSLISIIANLLVLPTVSIAMGLTFLTGLAAIIIPPLANIFGHLATLILDYQISVVNFFSDQKIFLIETESNNPAIFLLYVPLIVAFIFAACYARLKLHQKSGCFAKVRTG